MTDEQKQIDFINQTPMLTIRQLTSDAAKFALGEERTIVGERSFYIAVLDFLYWNLGPLEGVGTDSKIQELRKKAFAKFSENIVSAFPNCYHWKDQPPNARLKMCRQNLIKPVAGSIKTRKKQGYHDRHIAERQFWVNNDGDGLHGSQQHQLQHQQQDGHHHDTEQQMQQRSSLHMGAPSSNNPSHNRYQQQQDKQYKDPRTMPAANAASFFLVYGHSIQQHSFPQPFPAATR